MCRLASQPLAPNGPTHALDFGFERAGIDTGSRYLALALAVT